MEKVEVSVIGAGVIGLAIARELTAQGKEVVVLEKYSSFGQETSSRNSEVIHAGIYYPPESLKSKLCLAGNPLLYDICRSAGIKHMRCGKLIVATNHHEAARIESIYKNALSAGVRELRLLTREDIKRLEADVDAVNGIFSASTGIIDSHEFMRFLYEDARRQGALFVFGSEVVGIKRGSEGYVITTSREEEVVTSNIINAGGLFAEAVAAMAGFGVKRLGYRLYYCKGDYFSVSGPAWKLKHLVYPVPHEKGYGLGVHATINMAGHIRLGPDTEYIDSIHYSIDEKKNRDFFEAGRKYLPWLKSELVHADTCGIRPKLQGPEDGFRDFIIKEETDNGFPGFINLIGIESPGLTASLAMAEYVGNLLDARGEILYKKETRT